VWTPLGVSVRLPERIAVAMVQTFGHCNHTGFVEFHEAWVR
jgi:hypothetical protein